MQAFLNGINMPSLFRVATVSVKVSNTTNIILLVIIAILCRWWQ